MDEKYECDLMGLRTLSSFKPELYTSDSNYNTITNEVIVKVSRAPWAFVKTTDCTSAFLYPHPLTV